MITAPVSTLSSVRLDGNPVKFTFPHQDGFYASAIVPVTTRQHLLTADEQILLRRLAVFAGGFALVAELRVAPTADL